MTEQHARHRYSRVSRRIWADERVRRLSAPAPCGRYLWVWLLTCQEQSVLPGLIHAGEAGLAESIGWPLEEFRRAFGELIAEGLAVADWGSRLVFIPRRIDHDEPGAPNVVRHWRHSWNDLPDCDLRSRAHAALRDWAECKGRAWLEAFDESCQIALPMACPKPSRIQDQEQDLDPERERAPSRAGARSRRHSRQNGAQTSFGEADRVSPADLPIAAPVAAKDAFSVAPRRNGAPDPPSPVLEPLSAMRAANHEEASGEISPEPSAKALSEIETIRRAIVARPAIVALQGMAGQIEGWRLSRGTPLPWVLEAIDDAAQKLGAEDSSGHSRPPPGRARFLIGCVRNSRAPRPADGRPPGEVRHEAFQRREAAERTRRSRDEAEAASPELVRSLGALLANGNFGEAARVAAEAATEGVTDEQRDDFQF